MHIPEISVFYGIRITMYYEDHTPPHFHAEYNESKVIIDIENATVIKGIFPFKQLKLVLAWCEIHKEELVNNWKLAQEYGSVNKIEPLR